MHRVCTIIMRTVSTPFSYKQALAIANMAPAKGDLLARSDFPMYLISALGERHFLVAGGGGQAKTGVANAIEIYEVKKVGDGKILSSSVCRHDLGVQAPMNGAAYYDGRNHLFAAGLDDECHLFKLKYKVITPAKQAEKGKEDGTKVTHRKKSEKENAADENTDISRKTKQITFDVEKIKSVRTDFGDEGSFQKVVRFSPDGSILATGGADGHLRVWKTEDLHKLYEVKSHKSEIDDLDIHPAGSKIVTVSRDSEHCCCVWNTKDGKKHVDVKWPGKTEEYRFRACRFAERGKGNVKEIIVDVKNAVRFGIVEGKKDKSNLYTINIPSRRQTKPSPCFLAMWDGSSFKPKLIQNTGPEILSSMAVSNDGIYVGVGTMSGSVAVYIAFSLQKLYFVKEIHSIFVTGLDFMPISDNAKALSLDQDFTLLSISADNTVRVHQEPTRSSYSVVTLVILFVVVVFFIFWLISELGL